MSTAARILATLFVIGTAAVGAAWAAPMTNPNATCYIENGIIHVLNIDNDVHCVGRSDAPDILAVITSGQKNVVFGMPTNDTNVAVLFYIDTQCTIDSNFVECFSLAPTVCFIDNNGDVIVEHVYEDVLCIGRSDLNTSFVFNTGNNTNLTFSEPARNDDVMLRLFKDDNCSETIQTNPFIVCHPANGTFTTTVSTTVYETIYVVETLTVFEPCTPTTTQTTPTSTPTCTPLPAGPVCYIRDGYVDVLELPDSVSCIRRSDYQFLAFPTDGTVLYGVPTTSANVVITAFSDKACLGQEEFVLHCIEINDACPTPTGTPTPTATISLIEMTTMAVVTATVAPLPAH